MAALHRILAVIALVMILWTGAGGVQLWMARNDAFALPAAATAVQRADIIGPAFGVHWLRGLFTTFMVMFSHILPFIYFSGMNKGVAAAVDEHGLQGDFVEETKRLKSGTLRYLSPAMLLIVATAVIGQTSFSGLTPRYTHLVFILLTLHYTTRTWMVAQRNLRAHSRLLDRLDEAIAAKAGARADAAH